MGNLAYMLKSIGHEVSGSDLNVYPPMSLKLDEWKIDYKTGFAAESVKGKDLVIIGNAISRGNPEVEEVLNSGMEYMSMPQAIAHFFLKGKKVIVVAGTHGKTTTTFLIHHILKDLGLKPGLFVGGIKKDGSPGFEIGDGDYFVIEGDEYDSAFFDKASKFLHYRPYYLIITSIDFDHGDIFKNIGEIKLMFSRLLRLVPGNGHLFTWKGSKNLLEVTKGYHFSAVHPYEFNGKESILRLGKDDLYEFATKKLLKPNLIGKHNYGNAEAAIQLTRIIAPKKYNEIIKAFESFPGVKRRQEILFKSKNRILIEDFAHHPVAISSTIKAVKDAFPGFKLISLFEPRSATSHRNTFQKEFASSFKGSDYTLITELFNKNKVDKKIRLDVKKLIHETAVDSKTNAVYCGSPEDILGKLPKILKEFKKHKIVILAMSNGSFGGIYPKLTEMVTNESD